MFVSFTDWEFDGTVDHAIQAARGFWPLVKEHGATEGVLRSLWKASEGQSKLVFDLSPNAIRLAFEHIRQGCGLTGVRFHDLRHEAISRLFEKGLTMPEVASISGHRSLNQLMRYSHADTLALVDKLRS